MIFRGPYADISIPEITLTEFVFQRAEQWPGKTALVDGTSGRALTYAQLIESVRRAAAGLASRGFEKGDVLAIFSPNVPEYAVVFHAVATLGGTVTTLNPLCIAEDVEKQLNDSRAKYLVTIPQLLDNAREAAAQACVREIFVFGEAAGATPFASLLSSEHAAPPSVHINPREDVVALPYSSGTTGVAKGVMLTHHNMVANLLQIEGTGHAGGDDTLVCVLPLFHIYGMQVIMNFGLYMGATIVTVPRFDIEQVLKLMQDYKVTMAHVVPPLVLALAKNPVVDDYDLSSVKTLFSAAAPLGRELAHECGKRLGCYVKQGYGMTETSPATHMIPPEPEKNKPGSVGVCVPSMECKVIDLATGAELGPGEEGEICVRGPQVMKGYLNRPDATAQTIDDGGWLHTGDIGYADAEGFFYIVDRAKELIKYKAFQVAPAELEALLLSHPAVADAAVIPSPDDEAGEVPKAFVVRGADISEDEIMEFVAARVSPHKKVRKVEFVEQIPKSPSGKILRRILVQRERDK
ncbi:MAG: 4-coumarate--CoA ligase family protein [Acidobacteria bacterium]|nr:4-coumarate--CoA ligase family protein [Acidobacteriota bacterium]